MIKTNTRKELTKTTYIYLLVLIPVVWFAIQQVESTIGNSLSSELQKLQQRLQYTLQNYKSAPQLLQKSEVILDALRYVTNEYILAANQQLEEINTYLNADVSYLMTYDGLTIASSNYLSDDSFIGENFSFRPYFKQAINGTNSSYFALGAKSGKRGYYFASPVMDGQEIIGVIVIKVSLSFIDELWRTPGMDFIISDSDGVIFFSSRENWLYKTMYQLTENKKREVRKSLRYGNAHLQSISRYDSANQFDFQKVQLTLENREYSWLVESTDMLEWGLQIYSLKTLWSDWIKLIAYVFIYTLISLLFILVLLYIRKRKELQIHLKEMNSKLEFRVNELTADLQSSNNELINLVKHYKQTQNELQETQNQLIQATKLAVLGEFSAGLHHELAQPLQALHSYTSNCVKMINMGKTGDLQNNLNEITSICNTMTNIIKKFKVFARQSKAEPKPTSLNDITSATWLIIKPKIEERGIAFKNTTNDETVYCEPVLVEQVLVNLINNAIQALKGTAKPVICISGRLNNNSLFLTVSDNGPEVDAETIAHMFDPFYTTKKSGLGLGLTISRSIIESQNGKLDVEQVDGGGLAFIIKLNLYEKEHSNEPDPAG